MTSPWTRRIRQLRRSVRNATELMRRGRLGDAYRHDHEVVTVGAHHRLRHYAPVADAEAHGITLPLLLVPPLMVTAEVYDISPEVSAVAWLAGAGVDVWGVDFGAPEREAGGMERTLDDHILAVADSVRVIREQTGSDVALAGYSQGGLFVYQAAAFLRSEGVATCITFGSPVDMRRNFPIPVHEAVAARVLRMLRKAVDRPLDAIDGLPGILTSSGFKLLSVRKEIDQIIDFWTKLHDRDALEAREPRRRFLGGEGFVAWPGPALRTFVDQVVAGNRMASGGFVVDGRTVTLADIECPVLYFTGDRDELARPAGVRAIAAAAPHAETCEIAVPSGHFGIVVGSRSLSITWPAVVEWLRWQSGGPRPAYVERGTGPRPARPAGGSALRTMAETAWRRLGRLSLEVADNMDRARYQLPRMTRLAALHADERVSMGQTLAEQAERIPDRTFFIWNDRAFTYAEANEQVSKAAVALSRLGVMRGDVVGVFMANRPSFLIACAALSRLGAIAALINAGARGESLDHYLAASGARRVVTDARHQRYLPDGTEVWVTGALGQDGLRAGAVHLNPLVQAAPSDLCDVTEPDPGRGRDLAMLLFTSGTTGEPAAARITNMRQAAGGLAVAAACRLMPLDTVYCCLPLYHSTGIVAAVGGALMGGARLALAPEFSRVDFWGDVRRSGATVVFYLGELCRYLVNAEREPGEDRHPVRMFIGNGMRPDVWRAMLDRFRPERVLEFYASTEGNALLANPRGHKIGSVGRPFVQRGELALVRWSSEDASLLREPDGRVQRVSAGEVGMLVSRIVDDDPLARFDGYVDARLTEARIERDVFETGDAWFRTGDLMRVDDDGDYWFVDRSSDAFRHAGESISTEAVERVLNRVEFVAMAAVYPVESRAGGSAPMAAIELVAGAAFDGEALYRTVTANLTPAARPRWVRRVDALTTTSSFRRSKRQLGLEGIEVTAGTLWARSDVHGSYRPAEVGPDGGGPELG